MKRNEEKEAPENIWRDAMRYRFVRVADGVRISHEAARDPAAYDEAIDRAMRERGCGNLPAPKGISRGPTQAVLDVLAERRRQIEAEGWTPEHDDEHSAGEMAKAAACYALVSAGFNPDATITVWPWHRRWWKPSDKRCNLVKAAALILAEIERLDRMAAEKQEGE